MYNTRIGDTVKQVIAEYYLYDLLPAAVVLGTALLGLAMTVLPVSATVYVLFKSRLLGEVLQGCVTQQQSKVNIEVG